MQFSIFGRLLLFLSVACTLSLENAFSKERLNHLYPELANIVVVDHNSLLGVANDQLLNIRLDDTTAVQWSIQLQSLHGSGFEHYHLSGDNSLAYVYSRQSPQLYLFHTHTGVLKHTIKLEAPPVQVENFFGKGLLVVEQSGALKYVDNASGTVVGVDISSKLAGFHFQQIDGYGYIAAQNLIKLSSQLEVQYESPLPFSGVKQFKDELLLSDAGEIFRLSNDKVVKVDNSAKDAFLINSNYYIKKPVSAFVEFYHIDDAGQSRLSYKLETPSVLNVEARQYSLGDFLIVSKIDYTKEVYDLTDYLQLDDPESIKHVRTASRTKFDSDFITSDDEGNFLLISLIGSTGSKFSLSDGSLVQSFVPSPQFVAGSNKYYLFDKPASRTLQNKATHILDDKKSFVFVEIIRRYVRHLSELGKYITSSNKDKKDTENADGLDKLIVFYDDRTSQLVAIDSESGLPVWLTPIDGDFTDLVEIDGNLIVLQTNQLFTVVLADGNLISIEQLQHNFTGLSKHNSALILKSDTHHEVHSKHPATEDLYFIRSDGFQVNGEKISEGVRSVPTWEFRRVHEIILQAVIRPQESKSSSVGISLADKSVLYKYLYPNLVSIITKNQADNSLKLYLLDGITGSVLFTQEHNKDEIVDDSSINIIMDDNWVIYSYFVKAPQVEQRLQVIDLFDSGKSIKKSEDPESSFKFNTTIDSISRKSFIYPERLITLGSTQSSHGITLKSVIAVTESGALVEIPKSILNSRRIDDRPLTAEDYQNDYRMSPYAPVIDRNDKAILNHKHKLLVAKEGSILVRPTNYESTSVVCYFNKYNQFCSYVQPSLSFDFLSKSFAKAKLLGTIAVLLVVHLISKPIVTRRKLSDQWVDNK